MNQHDQFFPSRFSIQRFRNYIEWVSGGFWVLLEGSKISEYNYFKFDKTYLQSSYKLLFIRYDT